jgi:hypothetical protein
LPQRLLREVAHPLAQLVGSGRRSLFGRGLAAPAAEASPAWPARLFAEPPLASAAGAFELHVVRRCRMSSAVDPRIAPRPGALLQRAAGALARGVLLAQSRRRRCISCSASRTACCRPVAARRPTGRGRPAGRSAGPA